MSDIDLSGRIRQRREQLGLSQEELAARMGYRSKSSITKLEKGINDAPGQARGAGGGAEHYPCVVDGPCGSAQPAAGLRAAARDGAGAPCRLHRLRDPHHRRTEHRVLHRRPCRVAR